MTTVSEGETLDIQNSNNHLGLSIVIPAYNEITTIRSVIEQVVSEARHQEWEVIAVNDGSTDGTASTLNELEALYTPVLRVIHHPINRGYGASLKTGIRASKSSFVIVMDSDGQHSLEHVHLLLAHSDQFDLVIGHRTALIHSPLWRMPGKWLLTWLAEFLSQRRIPDLNSGMRLFRRDVLLRYLHLFPNGFSFSTTSTMIFINRGYNVTFVPISVGSRAHGSTIKLSTGFQTLLLILRLIMLLDPLRIFVPLSVLFVGIGGIWAIPYILSRRGLTTASLLFFLSGILIFFFGLLADQIAELRKERFEDVLDEV